MLADFGDDLDRVEENVRRERDAGVHRVRQALEPSGATECSDCGDQIPTARQKAAPFSTRCAPCQATWERRR